GVRQLRNPWADGAEYVNQCPIGPGKRFTYKVQLTIEEGTIWWHAHSGWARATLHGMIIVYPKHGATYPFPKPYVEVPIILGEWWKKNGKSYLLRIVNSIMDESMFFGIDRHKLTLVGTDGFYTKPFETEYIMITPGQSMDVLLNTNQPHDSYYLAARAYSSAFGASFDNTTTIGILHYMNGSARSNFSSRPLLLPPLPPYNATRASTAFVGFFVLLSHIGCGMKEGESFLIYKKESQMWKLHHRFQQGYFDMGRRNAWIKLRSLATKDHPIDVPLTVDTNLRFTVSVNLINCTVKNPCNGPLGMRFAASLNNISFVTPKVDVLRAYYYGIKGIFGRDFPKVPRKEFDYTGKNLTSEVLTPDFGTRALVLEYNASVELVLQGTNMLASDNHPMHLHGFGFYVVGWGFGNFDPEKDRLGYNLVDPPQGTTVGIPNNGWVAIRFRADNP
ncbi:laccase family protein, partial [Striga asiatica]